MEDLEGIRTELVCEDEEMILTCPDMFLLDIVSAMYGKRDDRYCYDGKQICDCEEDRDATLEIVKSKCGKTQTCHILANSVLFSEPCAGYRKYLKVTYKCLRSSHKIFSSHVCQDEALELKCLLGRLKIVKAFYGIKSTNPKCLNEFKDIGTTSCELTNATFIVQKKCNDLQICSVNVNSTNFPFDSCNSSPKFLEVQYLCIKEGIKQRVCQDKAMLLTCPSNYTIKMLSAFYGQREGWYCNEGRESYTTCEADNPLQLTENWCNQKQECTLKASSRVFKDPCPDVKKYLEVYYVCTQDGWKELACPDDTMKLSCPKGFVIDLQSVFYGRRNTYWCGGGSSDFCEVQNAFTVVKKMCNLKQKCSIMAASVSTFGDECPNIRKYLEVIYKCVKNEIYGVKQAIGCESGLIEIECPSDMLVKILHTFWGRIDGKICFTNQRRTYSYNCRSEADLSEAVQIRCLQTNSCHFQVDAQIFGDPCAGTSKYLEVDYLCYKMNPVDTRVLPAKLFISGSPSDNDVKHLSIEHIQILSGIN
ncbi:rhamnose-binding lectin-like isoform X2 [Rhodnius prolixus]